MSNPTTNKNQEIDIFFNTVKIPLENLREIAQIAVGQSRANVEKYLSNIQNFHTYNSGSAIEAISSAKYLKLAAENLEKSMNVLHAIESARTREIFEIVR